MPKKIKSLEESEKLKAVRRQKKKKIRMKVSGRSVIQLKRLIEGKAKREVKSVKRKV